MVHQRQCVVIEVFFSIALKQKNNFYMHERSDCTSNWICHDEMMMVSSLWAKRSLCHISQSNFSFSNAVLCNICISLHLRFSLSIRFERNIVLSSVREKNASFCLCFGVWMLSACSIPTPYPFHLLQKRGNKGREREKNGCWSCNMKKRNVRKFWKKQQKQAKNRISCYTTNGWIEIDIQR